MQVRAHQTYQATSSQATSRKASVFPFIAPQSLVSRRSYLSFGASRVRARVSLQPQANMLGNLFGKATGTSTQTKQQQKAQTWFSANAPTWDELKELCMAKGAQLGKDFFADPNEGPTHPLALKRTFGSTAPIRVKLYRDHAAWCPYCHKVWLQLEEKRIPYTIEKINMRCYGDKPREFLAKVPSGLLPVMEIDGRVVTESMVIMMILEREFPDHTPLFPAEGSPQRLRAEGLMRLERRFFSDWLNWLCSDWNHEQGKARFIAVMNDIEKELGAAGGPYFLGSDISLVDINFVPMLERAVASIAYYKGFYVRGTGRWPNLERWFAALETRPTYMGTKSDYYTHCHDLPPQLGGCAMSPEGVPVSEMIDGTHPSSWRLPLPPLSSTSLPEPYSLGDNPAEDCLEAACRMVANHAALTRFALRGPGKPGPRPVSAPLADPTAIPAEEYTAAGDMALRHVAHALLVGVDAKQASPQALQVSTSQPSGSGSDMVGPPIVQAAAYLRDRVGVPRDMRFPAARQLRAHLNWLIDNLEGRPTPTAA